MKKSLLVVVVFMAVSNAPGAEPQIVRPFESNDVAVSKNRIDTLVSAT
ncbi:MAG: hypothetical protein ACYTF1_02380 [Planctomycetota bacterium]|jgi:hypothetical protein